MEEMSKVFKQTQDIGGIKFRVGILSGFVGGLLGIIINTDSAPVIDKIEIYQRESKPAVMRLYKSGRDGILVENSEKKGEYIQLDAYLGKIPSKADRRIEEAEIRKAVRWYEE